MWRYAILAAAIVVAVVAVLAFRGKHGGESAAQSAPAKAQTVDTRGARIVHYRLEGPSPSWQQLTAASPALRAPCLRNGGCS